MCPIGGDNAKGEVSKVNNDRYGGKPVTMSHECTYSESLGNLAECVSFPHDPLVLHIVFDPLHSCQCDGGIPGGPSR